MDENTIMKMETIKKEPKKECEKTSKTLLKTLEQEEIEKSPYEKAEELGKKYGFLPKKDDFIYIHLEYAFKSQIPSIEEFDEKYLIPQSTPQEEILGKVNADELLLLDYYHRKKAALENIGGQHRMMILAVISVLEGLAKKEFLERVSRIEIPFHKIQLRRGGIFVSSFEMNS